MLRDTFDYDISISIHALREEGDTACRSFSGRLSNFYPRPPRGGRLVAGQRRRVRRRISIHALREEGDHRRPLSCRSRRNFYPRPPRGGRHGKPRPWRKHHLISIHALREEGDGAGVWRTTPASNTFLSTPSARRATAKTETKSLFSYKLYNILHEFRRALIYNGSKNDPNHAK